MSMSSRHDWTVLTTLLLTVLLVYVVAPQQAASQTFNVGQPVTPAAIKDWGVNISPSGDGLPAGGSTATEGRRIYQQRCARCHGINGTEGPDSVLVGGQGSLTSEVASKTVGSYWPLATTLWDYINRAMPFDQAGVLTADEVYGSVAYVLYLNGIIDESERMDATTVPEVQMPNRNGFVPDPRPDVD